MRWSLVSPTRRADPRIDPPGGRSPGPDAAERLAALLRPDDAFVAVAAKAPCKNAADAGRQRDHDPSHDQSACGGSGGARDQYQLRRGLRRRTGAFDRSHAEGAGSLHGVMHLAREMAFSNEVKSPLAILRPTCFTGRPIRTMDMGPTSSEGSPMPDRTSCYLAKAKNGGIMC